MTAFARSDSLLQVLIPIDLLRPHEEILEERVEDLIKDLTHRGVQVKPILVDSKTMIILDGHHRVEALKRIGAKRIAAVLVDYDSDIVSVGTWRPGYRVTKETVRRAGSTGKLLPPRTSRHRLAAEIPDAYVPLEELMR